MEEIKPLHEISFDDLFTAWDDAFKDYDSNWNKTQLSKMLHRRGYRPELSFGAFDDNKLVGFTLNGIGTFNGLKTAYDTGTGIINEYRGRGLTPKIFQYSLPYLKEAGITQYLLEILQHNTKAVSIYTNAGFEVSRSFNYYVQNMNEIQLNSKDLSRQYDIRDINFDEKDVMMTMWDFVPSWQNSFDAIQRKSEDFKIIGTFDGNKLAGYGIIEPTSGDIPQIAVSKESRRRGIGSGLLKELLNYNQASIIKIINTESTCLSLSTFLDNNHISQKGMQYEMVKKLS